MYGPIFLGLSCIRCPLLLTPSGATGCTHLSLLTVGTKDKLAQLFLPEDFCKTLLSHALARRFIALPSTRGNAMGWTEVSDLNPECTPHWLCDFRPAASTSEQQFPLVPGFVGVQLPLRYFCESLRDFDPDTICWTRSEEMSWKMKFT